MSSLVFRLKKIDETKSYLIEEIKHKDLTSEKYKKTCNYLNYVEHLLILVSKVTDCVLISAFALLVWAPVGVMSSAVGKNICVIAAGIKKSKSTIKKKKKKHVKKVLLGKGNSNTIEVLISKSFIYSC